MEFSELPSDAERIIQCVDDLKKKLLPVEAQRISRIWENCISQIEIVAILPSIPHNASSNMDKELTEQLNKHQLSCEQLGREIEGLEQGTEEEGTKRARSLLEKEVKSSVRDLLRFLRSHPDAIFALRAEQSMEKGESENKLIRELKGFHSHMLNKLLTSPFEESQSVLQNLATTPLQQVLHDLEHLSSLEAEIAKAIKQIDVKISQKNGEIENLRQQFSMLSFIDEMQQQQQHNHTSHTNTDMQYKIDCLKIQLNISKQENTEALVILHKENEKMEEILDLRQTLDNDEEEKKATVELHKNDFGKKDKLGMQETLQQELVSQLKDKKDQLQRNSLDKQASMQKTIAQLKIQLDKLKRENTNEELKLEEKNEAVEKVKKELRQTFDKKHEEKQGNLEMEELDNEMELNKLRKLEQAFFAIEEEYSQIQERLVEEQRRRQLLRIRTRAIVIAQAWWRGYSARKAMKKNAENEASDVKGKSKKGGKKGGKKGKSKKKK